MTAIPPIRCELCVIGSGIAGMGAALFAARQGLATAVVGRTGEIIFTTGLLDLMAVHPVEKGVIWDDPWACIAQLVQDQPQHPYARIRPEKIRAALDGAAGFLGENGLAYSGQADRNTLVLTSIGTFKPTYRIPATMAAGIEAYRRRATCLLVDFKGLKGFSAAQIAATAGPSWPGLRTARIEFPDVPAANEVFAERMARALEASANREKLAAAIRPHVQRAETVGLPAILGMARPADVMEDLQRRLNVKLFEIPTIPPGVTGLRLKEAFERGLSRLGVRLCLENKVFQAEANPAGGFRLYIGRSDREEVIEARAVILATGRFMGGGLRADRSAVSEPLFNLPVYQPEGRELWHREDFFDPRGHAVNRAGLAVDADFRPLDASGRPAHPRLFAAGSILAHQDWMRMKCGSGLALSTAWAAVESAKTELSKTYSIDPEHNL
jgi:glycerol-3-phosphate dehydrogenase subunit B